MSWPPFALLVHPRLCWSLDATSMDVSASQLGELPWDRTFHELSELEAGALANSDEKRQVGHFWLRAPEQAPTIGQAKAIGETTIAVRSFATGVRTGTEAAEDGLPYTDVLHIGIGGSSLGPSLLVSSLSGVCAKRRALQIHFLDNIDPDGLHRTLSALEERLRHTLVVVVSKSGTTPETLHTLRLVQEAMRPLGLETNSHLIAITQENSLLWQRAKAEAWRLTLPLWPWVGGRFSVTSAAGLLTAELAGVDSQALLEGARDMDAWTRVQPWSDNPAAWLAGCWHVIGAGQGNRHMVVLPYSDRLAPLSRYLQQVVMESIGKRFDRQGREVHQGLTVYGNKGSTDQHATVQQLRDGRDDFFVLFVQVLGDGRGSTLEVEDHIRAADLLQGFLLGTRHALHCRDRSTMTVTVSQVDAYSVGGLIALFERAVSLYGFLIDVNAYHQPGVEAGKSAAKEIVTLSRDLRAALSEGPASCPALAERLSRDPIEVWHVLERLVASGRITRDGTPPHGTYRLRYTTDG